MTKEVRTRFAPSPTGYIHIGNIRSAIYPWLVAKQNGGKFILRIEDTDRARFVEGAEDLVISTMQWLGLNWDEGPDIGGKFGPYRQTERREIYIKWAEKLIEKGLAYADPYTPEELQAFREESQKKKQAFLYRNHRPENPPKWEIGMPLRFKVENPKRYTWNDAVMGELTAGPEALDDFVLVKSDGLPTYNFAHIVDDAEMEVTHVMRGVEYVSSTPNYLALYEALELEPPILVSLPHIMAPSGNKKLGKRDGAKSVEEYRRDGYLKEAMLNFLATLGWNDGTEQEIFTTSELIDKFSLDRIQKSGARFDENRLLWMNGQWIRRLALDDLYKRCTEFWPESAKDADEGYKKLVLSIVQDRLKVLSDLNDMTDYFFKTPVVDIDMILNDKKLKKYSKEQIQGLIQTSVQTLSSIGDWNRDDLQAVLNKLLEETGEKPAVLFSLIRISLSFAPFSPALNEMMEVLGKDESLARLNRVSETLS